MGGTNLYQYAPNPVGWVDPLGLMKSRTSAKKIANQRAKQLQNDKNSLRMVTIVVDRKRGKIYFGGKFAVTKLTFNEKEEVKDEVSNI